MLAVCNVVLVVSEGMQLDVAMMRYLKRAELLKFSLPDFPLIPPATFGQTQHDMHYYPDIGKMMGLFNMIHDDLYWH